MGKATRLTWVCVCTWLDLLKDSGNVGTKEGVWQRLKGQWKGPDGVGLIKLQPIGNPLSSILNPNTSVRRFIPL